MNSEAGQLRIVRIDKGQLKADLKNIGISEGDHLAVTLSLKSIGFVSGGPNTLIDALLETIGGEGTLMMNTYTLSFPLAEINPDYVFDPELTTPYTGKVTEIFMKRREVIRSRHPTCSVAATGRLAKHLTNGHDEHSSPYLPYTRLAQIGGKYLCIGTDNRLVAIRHEAQRRAGLFVVPVLMGVQYKNSKGEVDLFKWVAPPCVRRQPELVSKLEKMEVIKRGKIGMATSFVGPADKIIDVMSTMLRKNPTLNLCHEFSCMRCRALEKRMNLYARVENPKIFQKSSFIRNLLNLRNKLILRHYGYVSFGVSKGKQFFHPDVILETGLRRSVWLFSKILEPRNS